MHRLSRPRDARISTVSSLHLGDQSSSARQAPVVGGAASTIAVLGSARLRCPSTLMKPTPRSVTLPPTGLSCTFTAQGCYPGNFCQGPSFRECFSSPPRDGDCRVRSTAPPVPQAGRRFFWPSDLTGVSPIAPARPGTLKRVFNCCVASWALCRRVRNRAHDLRCRLVLSPVEGS